MSGPQPGPDERRDGKICPMIGGNDLRAIARRAAKRAMAAAGGAGFHSVRTDEDHPLVTAACLKQIPDGGVLHVSTRARFTPLAAEVAFERRIRFEVGTPDAPGAADSGPVAIASDHGGFALKGILVGFLRELGRQPLDLGPRTDEACDYPDFAAAVARRVASGEACCGVVIDGAGIGSAMAANKIPGVLAANCWNVASARNAREHNHANVLTLGAGHLDAGSAYEILAAFLGTSPGDGRHARRVGLIRALEHHKSPEGTPRT